MFFAMDDPKKCNVDKSNKYNDKNKDDDEVILIKF